MKKFNILRWLFRKEPSSIDYPSTKFVQGLSQVPQETNSVMYVVGEKGSYKWVVFACPDNCGQRVEVNLMTSRYPRWKVKIKKRKVTLSPSVVVDSCGAHFWIEDNKVWWAIADKENS